MEKFSLSWNNYLNQMTDAFVSLRDEEDLVDVTLSCEGRKIKAHKMLLSACSPYFFEIFKENPCQHPVIVFRNIKCADLEAVIDYVYRGEVSIEQDELESFLETARLLEIKGLSADSTSEENAQPENVELASKAKLFKNKSSRSQSPDPSSYSKRQKTSKQPEPGSLDEDVDTPKSNSPPLTIKEEIEDNNEDAEDSSFHAGKDADYESVQDNENSLDSGAQETENYSAENGVSTVDDKKNTIEADSSLRKKEHTKSESVIKTNPLPPSRRPTKMRSILVPVSAKGRRLVRRRVESSKFVARQQRKRQIIKDTLAQQIPLEKKVILPKDVTVTPVITSTSRAQGGMVVEQSAEESVVMRSEDAKTPVGEDLHQYQEQPVDVGQQFQASEPEMAEEAPDLTVSAPEEEVKEPEFDYYGCLVCKADAKPVFDKHSFTHKCPICPCLCFCSHLLKEHMRVIHGWFNVQRKFTHF